MRIHESITGLAPVKGDYITFQYANTTYTCQLYFNYLTRNGVNVLLHVYGKNYTRKVNRIYGYKTKGYFPEHRDIKDLLKLFDDLRSRGVVITY